MKATVEKQCKNCIHFKSTEGIYGICKLVEDGIGENVHKFQWCKEFQYK